MCLAGLQTSLTSRRILLLNHIQWYVLALSSTFAGNLITLGSIANLITLEQAGRYGVKISFIEHAKTGLPVTAASFLITLLWIWLSAH